MLFVVSGFVLVMVQFILSCAGVPSNTIMAHPAPDRYMAGPPPAPDQPSCQLPKVRYCVMVCMNRVRGRSIVNQVKCEVVQASGGYCRPEEVLSHTTLTLYRKLEVRVLRALQLTFVFCIQSYKI